MSNKNLNVPNVLTLIRLLLVPATVFLIAENHMVWALIVFLTACGTDLLDGYIARRYNLTTKLGIWLDPLADKLMALFVVISFTVKGILPLPVTIILLAKEFLMLLGGLIILRKGAVTPSNRFGKISAFLLNTCIASGFLHEYLAPYYLYATYAALAVMVVAFVQYAVINGHYIFDKKPKEKEQ